MKINEKKFMQQAQKIANQTDTDIFGPQDEYLRGFRLFLAAPDQKLMSASGILLLNGLVQGILNSRRRSIEYIQAHRDVILSVGLICIDMFLCTDIVQ